jgi:hypothetical protein
MDERCGRPLVGTVILSTGGLWDFFPSNSRVTDVEFGMILSLSAILLLAMRFASSQLWTDSISGIIFNWSSSCTRLLLDNPLLDSRSGFKEESRSDFTEELLESNFTNPRTFDFFTPMELRRLNVGPILVCINPFLFCSPPMVFGRSRWNLDGWSTFLAAARIRLENSVSPTFPRFEHPRLFVLP